MKRVERHIIDLDTIGFTLMNFLNTVFRDDANKQEIIEYAYRELIAQMLLTFTEDYQDTQLKLIGLPNMASFQHLPSLSDPFTYDKLVDLVRHIGDRLYTAVTDACHTEPNTQFFFDSASYTYLVVIKQVD